MYPHSQFSPPSHPHPHAQPHPVGVIKCPYCGALNSRRSGSKISTAGWIFFWILLLFLCLPFCWIGLLFKDYYSFCGLCGQRWN